MLDAPPLPRQTAPVLSSQYVARPTPLRQSLSAAEVLPSTKATVSRIDIRQMAQIVEQDELGLEFGI
jgi:class 3 adenylate cyclase